MATIVMSEMLSKAPFEELGEKDFIPIGDLVGVPVEFIELKEFENDKGPGIYLMLMTEEGDVRYTTTHSGALMSLFAKPEVRLAFVNGDTIKGTIVERRSKKTGNTYFAVE